MNSARRDGSYLFEGSEWDFETLHRTYEAIAEIAIGDLGLDIYPNQIEIISSEQMLDAYASHGMPLMYQHWSFGKHFLRDAHLYRKGYTGLAYEIVINSNPCISYNMEENSMALQTLVMAHAAFGHNHFFKNNYLFRQWTDADVILDYLDYGKRYIAGCEERHGSDAVEAVLDSAHALMDQGVFAYERKPEKTDREQRRRDDARREQAERSFNDLWRTVPASGGDPAQPGETAAATRRRKHLKLPEENLLYFLEKHSPTLEPWQREVLAIVQAIAQYFHPQKQTKIMNEGCATFVHYYIATALQQQRRITDGAYLEMLHNHVNVIRQPGFDQPDFNGINPYALGFAMMADIRRICCEADDEDREWFPDIAGCDDWRGVLKHAWANYRDESFIRQFLSPHLIRKLRLFVLADESGAPHYKVGSIHDEAGYRAVRAALARSVDTGAVEPDLQVADADLRGDRALHLRHTMRDGIVLDDAAARSVLDHVRHLWGYDVTLTGVQADSQVTRYSLSASGGAAPSPT